MIALTRLQRTLALFFSACTYVAWFSGIDDPLEARGIDRTPSIILSPAPPWRRPHLDALIRRDPFAGAPERSDVADGTNGIDVSQTPDANAREVADRVASGSLATNAGSPSTEFVLRATIAGPNPVGYVANGAAMEIVRVGDRLGERVIVKIDLRGLTFSDGTHLDLPDAYAPTPPAPRVEPARITLRLDQLRALLRVTVPDRSAPARTMPTAASVPSPSVADAGRFPTPGALPTVNQRGFTVGTNPTFDPTAPTPYPEPYPYAPPARRP